MAGCAGAIWVDPGRRATSPQQAGLRVRWTRCAPGAVPYPAGVAVISSIQIYLFLGLTLVGFALEAWALFHAVRTPGRSFEAADKRTKTFWVAVLAAAVVIGFLCIPEPLGFAPLPVFLGLIAIVPAGIYLADVRPAVDRYSGRGRRDDSRW